MPAPRLIITHPAPTALEDRSVLPAEPVMFIPAIAVPVAVVMLIPLMPLIPLMTWPFDMVMESPIDIPRVPDITVEPLAAAPAVVSLPHIMVTTFAEDVGVPDGAVVMPDCARARGAAARTVAAKILECIVYDMFERFVVDYGN